MNAATRLHGLGWPGGFTLVELLIVIVLLAVIVALAAPSFSRLLAKKRVEGIGSELATDLQYARSEAAQRNEPVRVSFGAGCYVVHTGSGSASCSAGAPSIVSGGVELKTVAVAQASMAAAPGSSPVEFDPHRGTASTEATIEIVGVDGAGRLRTIVSLGGQVRVCTPDGSVAGFAAC